MSDVPGEQFPTIATCNPAQKWVQLQSDFGRAPHTIDAYTRALEDYLSFCSRQAVHAETAKREDIARYVHDLSSRPNPHGIAVRVLDSGVGLANATMQQRLTVVRLFYDYLMEEGLRQDNPVGRGRYTVGKGFGGQRDRALIPRYQKLPGSLMMSNGKRCLKLHERNRCAIASCSPWPTMQGCGGRNCVPFPPMTLTLPIACCISVPNTPRIDGHARFRTRKRRVCCTWP